MLLKRLEELSKPIKRIIDFLNKMPNFYGIMENLKPKQKMIYISSKEEQRDLVIRLLDSTDGHKYLDNAFDYHFIFMDPAQIFIRESLERFIRSKSLPFPKPQNYSIYIGDDIMAVNERIGGVELPAGILYDRILFRDEFLLRVRKYVGSARDN